MRLRLAVPPDLSRDETASMLDAALESLTRASEPRIARGALPTFGAALKAGRVKWAPEPPGDEHFDLPETVLKRGTGDCDDLAPWQAASRRATGEDPGARAIVRPSGPGRWHAVVQLSDGRIEDPSRAAGMGRSVNGDGYRAPFWRAMFGDRLSLAAHPLRGGWAGRVDVPDDECPMAWSALARASTPRQAVVNAISGALGMGECGAVSDADLMRLAALHDLLHGVRTRDVAGALDQMGCVGFLPSLIPAAASLAAPVLSKVLPGAKGAEPAGGGGGHGMPGGLAPGATLYNPGGPIIVRF